MKMGEFDITALGVEAESADLFDKDMPGWRDMTLVEFADELPKLAERLRREGKELVEITKQLLEGGGK